MLSYSQQVLRLRDTKYNLYMFLFQDIASEHPERFFVGEIVREKIFLQYRQEIPYACQVYLLVISSV